MQADIPQISWHDENNKIMSIDFYPNSSQFFVTSSFNTGEDSGIRLSSERFSERTRCLCSQVMIECGRAC